MSSQSGNKNINNDETGRNNRGANMNTNSSPPAQSSSNNNRNQPRRGGGGGGGAGGQHQHQRGQNQGTGGGPRNQTHHNHHHKRPVKQSDNKEEELNQLEKATSSRRRKLTSLSSMTSSSPAISCICCLHDLNTYVYYQCGHFVCLNCAVKMRVLCSKLDCPVCRQESKSVVCTKRHMGEDQANKNHIEQLIKNGTRAPEYKEDISQAGAASAAVAVPQVNVGIYFERADGDRETQIREEYADILANKCDICSESGASSTEIFNTFRELDVHLRRVHKRFFCELCLQNLKLFPYERKHYTREELALHKRNGDKDDYSFKGHPLCEHCDERFFDRDELYRHYRKEHYYCHFCDTDGHEEYYRDYKQLRLHFLKYHHLCELDNCSANAAETHEYVVFRSELDFQAHKKQKHAKTKSEVRAYSKINIEFNQGDNRHRRGAGRGAGAYNNNNNNNNHRSDSNEEEYDEPPQSTRSHNNNNNRQRGNNQRQNGEVDSNSAARGSREQQFERDEDPRRRRTEAERLKEQYEKYNEQQEKQQPQLSGLSEIAAAISERSETKVPETVVNEIPAATANAANTTWRDLIGSGSAPSINKDAEFPSLAALGAAIETSTGPSSRPFPFATTSMSSNKKQSAWEKKKPEKSVLIAEENNDDHLFSIKHTKKKKNKQKSDQQVNSLDEAVHKIDPVVNEEVKPSKSSPSQAKADKPSTMITSPPPGFDKPPPGFEAATTKKASTPTKSDTIGPNSTTVNNNSTTQQAYIQPDRFDQRNQDLRTNLFSLFGHYNETEFDTFKSLSHRFRSGDLSATDYLSHCEKLLDITDASTGSKNRKQEIKTTRSKFYNLVQEMIILLPDLQKQDELYMAYVTLGGSERTISSSPISLNAWGSSSSSSGPAIIRCEFCTQYLTNDEVNFHQMTHHGKQLNKSTTPAKKTTQKQVEEFPSLMSSPAPSMTLNWASKKTPETSTDQSDKPQSKKKTQSSLVEEFPPLSTGPTPSLENRYSAMPSASIFSNPSSHLSLVNKKKHRLQK